MTVSFNLKPGVSLGDAVDRLGAVAARTLPDTMQRELHRQPRRCSRARCKNLTLLLIVAIGVVYIVLGVLYESYIHPITILSGLPSAGVGALLTLIVFKVDLNIYSFVGLVHAGGPGEEERHHADRFCAGSRAQEAKDSRRSHL